MTTTTSTFRRSCADAPIVSARVSTRADGDFHLDGLSDRSLTARRRALVDASWVQLSQPHGCRAVEVTDPALADGAHGDIAVTSALGVVLGCWTADCAPVALVGHTRIAVVHAGWRGMAAGVFASALAALDEPVEMGFIGPTIGPCCYEFGIADARRVADGVGCALGDIARRSEVDAATCHLDLLAAVEAALPVVPARLGACTGCTYDGFSHRVRGDAQRHVMAVWQHRTGLTSDE